MQKAVEVVQFLALAGIAIVLLLITLQCSGVNVMGRTIGPVTMEELRGEDFRRVTKVIVVVDAESFEGATGRAMAYTMRLRGSGYGGEILFVDRDHDPIGSE